MFCISNSVINITQYIAFLRHVCNLNICNSFHTPCFEATNLIYAGDSVFRFLKSAFVICEALRRFQRKTLSLKIKYVLLLSANFKEKFPLWCWQQWQRYRKQKLWTFPHLHVDRFHFLSSSDSNVMVVKSIHNSKDVSKRNGFWSDYLSRRNVNVTVERQASKSVTVLTGVKFSNVWKDSEECFKTLLHVRTGRP